MSFSVSIALSTLFLTWNTFLPLTVQASKSRPLNVGCVHSQIPFLQNIPKLLSCARSLEINDVQDSLGSRTLEALSDGTFRLAIFRGGVNKVVVWEALGWRETSGWKGRRNCLWSLWRGHLSGHLTLNCDQGYIPLGPHRTEPEQQSPQSLPTPFLLVFCSSEVNLRLEARAADVLLDDGPGQWAE